MAGVIQNLAKKTLPLSYTDEAGWVLDVEEALPPLALQAAARWAYKVNSDRFRAMRPGPTRDRAMKALQELKAGKITQRIPAKGSADLFKSTKRTTTTTYFHG